MPKLTASTQYKTPQKIVNPCVRNCCLDDRDVCLGCFRTLEEILTWRSLPKKQREAVLIEAEKRRTLNTG